jgi:hypothetical protein
MKTALQVNSACSAICIVTILYSLLTTRYSLLTTRYSLFTTH